MKVEQQYSSGHKYKKYMYVAFVNSTFSVSYCFIISYFFNKSKVDRPLNN